MTGVHSSTMLEDAHRQAALDMERSIADLGDPAAKPWNARVIIELYWGAAFHWIAYGCQVKHGKHKENHTKLGKYLRDLGEPAIAQVWDGLEGGRRGGWYGNRTSLGDVAQSQTIWQEIQTWATT